MADQYNQFGEKVVKPDDPAVIKAALSAKPQPARTPPPVTGSSGGNTLGDAISSAVGSAGRLVGPQSIVQRKAKIDSDTAKALGDQF